MANLTELFELAAERHGVITTADLESARVSRGMSEGLARRGIITRVARGIFTVAGAPATARQRTLVECVRTGGAAVRSTAAWLHGIHGFSAPPERPEVMRPDSRSGHRTPTGDLRPSIRFGDADIVRVDQIPTISVPWTLFSLAGEIPGLRDRTVGEGRRWWLRQRFRDAVDVAVRDRLCTDGELRELLQRIRTRGRPGVAEMEAVLDERRDAPTESHLEREFLRVLDEHGLPRPVAQDRIVHDGRSVARVDFRYPGSGIVIEVLGYRYHSSRAQLRRDAERRGRLALVGLRVVEFTYDMVVNDPAEIVRIIRQLLDDPSVSALESA